MGTRAWGVVWRCCVVAGGGYELRNILLSMDYVIVCRYKILAGSDSPRWLSCVRRTLIPDIEDSRLSLPPLLVEIRYGIGSGNIAAYVFAPCM